MALNHNDKKSRKRYLGRYTLPDGHTEVGELRLDGSRTSLTLHSDSNLDIVREATYIKGVAYTGEFLSLIDCQSAGAGHSYVQGRTVRYHADVFPHYVAVGQGYLEPHEACVRSIEFTTTDIATLFYDFDAFGHVIDAPAVMKAVVQEREESAKKYGFTPREMQVGDHPEVFYFSGRISITEVKTAIGLITVEHRPAFSSGGPKGLHIKNRIVVSITPEKPVVFREAINALYDVTCFLSAAAGRFQGATHIRVKTTEIVGDFPLLLEVYPSFRLKGKENSKVRKPSPGDLPLDPIQHSTEFKAVLSDWIERHPTWSIARARQLDCLRKANRYGPDRLVAAANMFDLLPENLTPVYSKLPEDLAATRDACVALFKAHAASSDRDGALSALGRLGKPSLPKKVSYRASLVIEKMGHQFPDLQIVAATAIKCRNYFVHGGGDFDYRSFDEFVPFFTDALEFIFVASDLIEAGWEPKRWLSQAHGTGHMFAHFRWDYDYLLAEFHRARSK